MHALSRGLAIGLVTAAIAASDPGLALGQEVLQVKLKVLEPKGPAPVEPTPEGEEPKPVEPEWPKFRAIALARPGLVAADFKLKELNTEPPKITDATKSVKFKESDEPMALVVLIQGNFRWMGNETYTDPNDPESGATYDGAFKGLPDAVDALAKAGPPKSKAALLVYADGKAVVKQPMSDAAALTGTAVGGQQEYSEYISKPLVVGLTEGWKLLVSQENAGHRKILVIFGDGNDDSEDITGELNKVLEDLKKAEVEVYSIYYTAVAEESPQGQQNMKKIGYERHYNATSRDNFASFANNIVEFIGAKYYVDFSGKGYDFDGSEIEFIVDAGGEESDPILIKLPIIETPDPPEETSWLWLWILIICLVAIIFLWLIIRWIKKRRKVPEEPMPMMEPPPAPMSNKTIMLGVGGQEDSMPIVGWVVPMSGPHAYQTFKLLQGATKLGTGGGAHIVIADGFMSTEHAEIVCSAAGFVLNDLGSTNGTFVNERRITSHELVDNDVFKVGKTDLKFKSIN